MTTTTQENATMDRPNISQRPDPRDPTDTSADATYHRNVAAARRALEQLSADLDNLTVSQAGDPRNWGYAGSAGKALDDLGRLHRFLADEDEDDER